MTENNENDEIGFLTPNTIEGAETSVKIILLAQDQINQIVSGLREDLNAERKGIPLNVNRIKTEIRNKEQELYIYQRKIENYKKRAKQQKGRIKEWKQLYGEVSMENKEAEREKLIHEIKHRSGKIDAIERKVGRKLPKEIILIQQIDFLNMKLELYQQEKFEGPIDQDPRMLEVLNQQKEISDSLKSAYEQLEYLKKQAKVTK